NRRKTETTPKISGPSAPRPAYRYPAQLSTKAPVYELHFHIEVHNQEHPSTDPTNVAGLGTHHSHICFHAEQYSPTSAPTESKASLDLCSIFLYHEFETGPAPCSLLPQLASTNSPSCDSQVADKNDCVLAATFEQN